MRINFGILTLKPSHNLHIYASFMDCSIATILYSKLPIRFALSSIANLPGLDLHRSLSTSLLSILQFILSPSEQIRAPENDDVIVIMEAMKNMLRPKPNPQQQLREWQRKLRQEARNVERQVRDIEREEKNVRKAIKEAVKRNDIVSAKSLAKEIVRSRRIITRLYENRAQLNSISMHLGETVATARVVGHLSKSSEVMKLVNGLMKVPEMSATMQEFTKEMTKAGVMEEFVTEAVDSTLDTDDIEEEIEEEVDKVLSEVAGETIAQLPATTRKERVRPPSVSEKEEGQEALAEGVDDEEELETLRARLANVRS